MKQPILLLALAASLLAPLAATHAADDLEKNFVNPPDSAKPSGYWWWLNANVDKEAITRSGVGGTSRHVQRSGHRPRRHDGACAKNN